jgi:hypothetical protein
MESNPRGLKVGSPNRTPVSAPKSVSFTKVTFARDLSCFYGASFDFEVSELKSVKAVKYYLCLDTGFLSL